MWVMAMDVAMPVGAVVRAITVELVLEFAPVELALAVGLVPAAVVTPVAELVPVGAVIPVAELGRAVQLGPAVVVDMAEAAAMMAAGITKSGDRWKKSGGA